MKKDRRLTHCHPLVPMFEAQMLNVNLSDISAPLENFIFSAGASLYEFFHSNGYMIWRSEWDTRKIVPALLSHPGWVYAFYAKEDVPIYVGETGRTFKERFAEHSEKPWWFCWERVKVLPCPDQSMRKVFESLIGLAGGYLENKLQPTGGDNIFDSVIVSLLRLGNDEEALPTFPNEMVSGQAEMILDLLSN